jgi:hypothetical protein
MVVTFSHLTHVGSRVVDEPTIDPVDNPSDGLVTLLNWNGIFTGAARDVSQGGYGSATNGYICYVPTAAQPGCRRLVPPKLIVWIGVFRLSEGHGPYQKILRQGVVCEILIVFFYYA